MRVKLAVGDTITAVLSGAKTSLDCKVLVRTSDYNGESTAWVTTNGVTAVTLFTAVNQGSFLEGLSLYNKDTGAITVTLSHVVGGTGSTLAVVTLAIGDTLSVGPSGIVVTNASGQLKTSAVKPAKVVSAVTATTGGGTTGLIPAGTDFVVVTSDSANKSIQLPAGTVGEGFYILVGATGCELIASVAADKVNDVVVGATNEAALVATNLYYCHYVATNLWVVTAVTKLGAVVTALVPDALA